MRRLPGTLPRGRSLRADTLPRRRREGIDARVFTDRLRSVPWDALDAQVALPAIGRVLAGAAAEREVDRALRGHRLLPAAARTAVVEAIFGVALWRRRLAWHTGGCEIPAALLTSLLRDLALVPERRACALAVLAQPPPRRDGVPPLLADRWSLPDWLAADLERELGPAADAFCAAISTPGPVCLRVNRLRGSRDQVAAALRAEGIATRPGQRSFDALIVETRNANLFGAQAWREGLFEPQDEGSQLVGQLVRAQAGETVLDLCAGAGGKSLLLAAQGATVLAYDVDRERLSRLRTRARRALATHIEVVGAPAPADRVLVDAPCSELGTLRRGPDARWRTRPHDLAGFPPLQAALLEQAALFARKRVVYATCTIRRDENEAVAAAFEARHPAFHRSETLRLLPHEHGTDGFFAVAWDRTPP